MKVKVRMITYLQIFDIRYFIKRLLYIFIKLLSIKDDNLQKCFYVDMKEIVDEKIKEMEKID